MAKPPLRIGVLGLNHDHVWDHLEELAACRDSELVGVADPRRHLRERAAAVYGCREFERTETLLEQGQLDAVYVFSDNRGGVDRAQQAAAAGLSILIEKPLAADAAGARAICDSAAVHQVRVMVNWPFAWWPQLQQALRLVNDGVLGDIWQVKYRAAHEGPREMGCSEDFCEWLYDPERNGGGALIDYCCYGALLSRLLLGLPDQVSCHGGRWVKEDQAAEDNAVLLMLYPKGLGIAEASWTQIGKLSAYTPLIYGTRGTLQVEPRLGGHLLLADQEHPEGRTLDVPEPSESLSNASQHFADCLLHDRPFQDLCRWESALDAQRILEAAKHSMSSAALVPPPK